LKQAFGSEAETKIAILKKVLLELFRDYSQINIAIKIWHNIFLHLK
jgi:hypothetical protein